MSFIVSVPICRYLLAYSGFLVLLNRDFNHLRARTDLISLSTHHLVVAVVLVGATFLKKAQGSVISNRLRGYTSKIAAMTSFHASVVVW